MARPQKFSEDDLLDAALAVVGRDGRAATVAQIAAEAGGNIGSVYYRFGSRELLLARLWVRSIQHFHKGFLAGCERPEPEAALVAAARSIPEFCRRNPDEARALTLFRHTELVERLDELQAPPDFARQVVELNDVVVTAVTGLIRRRYGRVDDELIELVAMVVQQTPYGQVRPFVDSRRLTPAWLPDVVAAMVPPALALGDAWAAGRSK